MAGVTQIAEQTAERQVAEGAPCPCESFARSTERAALAAARWLGSGDQSSAELEASRGMREALDDLQIEGRIVIGAGEESELLPVGAVVGSGGQPFDLAVHPLEGRGVVARGGNGAMSMIAVGDPGSLLTLPDMYMRKLAVGPLARGSIDINRPMADNIDAIAGAFGRGSNDVTTI